MGGRLSEAGRSQGLPFFGGKSKADKGATASPGTWAFWGLCQSRGRRPQGNKQADECKKCDNELPRPKRPPLSASKAPGPNCPHPAQWLRPSVEEAAQGLGRKAPMQATAKAAGLAMLSKGGRGPRRSENYKRSHRLLLLLAFFTRLRVRAAGGLALATPKRISARGPPKGRKP